MKKVLLAAVTVAVMACSCTTIAPPSVSAIDRAQAAYDRIAGSAELILPFVSPERAARIRLVMALTERGLLAARNAATAAERLAALKQAAAATTAIETTAGSYATSIFPAGRDLIKVKHATTTATLHTPPS